MPRNNVPLYIMLPPAERARLDAFAATIARPLSWCVRDALRLYLDAVEADAGRIAALRAPPVDIRKAGRTVQGRLGRPPNVKSKVNVR